MPGALEELGPAGIRFLEEHETRAHALGGRELRDLGDCLLLHAPDEVDPFVNRIGRLRLPEDPRAFDRRLDELLLLFATLDRRPHAWTAPAYREPADLEERLIANGFALGLGAHVLVIDARTAPDALRVAPAPGEVTDDPDVTVERWRGGAPRTDEELAAAGALLAASFGLGSLGIPSIVTDLRGSLTSPAAELVVLRAGERLVAAGKRSTFDGASYLAAIGTAPDLQGRGLGTLLVRTLVADALADGVRWTHLAVRTQNDRANALYRRCGFDQVGERAGELLLQHA